MEKLKKEKKKNGFIAKNEVFVPTKNTKGISTMHNPSVSSKTATAGITLVALVVTIVVLLILAGITIIMLFGENGIIKKAQDAADATKNDQNTTEQGLQNLVDQMDEALGVVKIPEGLEVGSTVEYTPSGEYKWQAKYCSSTKTPGTDTALNDDVILKSSEANYSITSWKVLNINNANGEVTLVPSSPTTGTVYLGEAQGYNNGVKLLNDACSSLYGNTSKGISARSINITDIEDYMLPEKLTEVTGPSTNYKKQLYGAYTTANSNYPVIYAYEKLSVINADPGKEKTLDLSDSPTNASTGETVFIERTTDSATNGELTASTSIQPYHAYWYKDATYMKDAFKPFDEENTDKGNYYSLIMPKGTSTTYWVASRCVNTYSSYCNFNVRYVGSGRMSANFVYLSNGNADHDSYALFPVVTLSSGLIEGDATSGFSVK